MRRWQLIALVVAAVLVIGGIAAWHVVGGTPVDARDGALVAALLAAVVGTAGTLVHRERSRRLQHVAANEARLVDTLRRSLDAVVAFDTDLRITFFNAAAERTYRCRAEEAIGQSLASFMVPELRDAHVANLLAYMESSSPSMDFGGLESSYAVRADGSRFPLEGILTRGGTGDHRVFTLIVRDVTDRLRDQTEREEALSLLRATLESTADGLLVVRLDGRVMAHNRRFLDIWNVPEDVVRRGDDAELQAATFRQLREPEKFAPRLRALLDDPSLESYDVVDLIDGRKLERVSRPQRLGDRIVGRVWTFRDVTARELSASALRRSEANARAFVDRSPYGICRVSLEARVLSANPALVAMLGHASEEVLLRTDVNALHADPSARLALMRRHDAGEDSVCLEAVWRRVDGSTLPVRLTSQRVRDPRGAPLHYLCYVENLAPLRSAEQALHQAEKLAAIGELVSGIAHELNNPLAAVLLLADELLEERATDDERAALVQLHEQAMRARAIVRDLVVHVRGTGSAWTAVVTPPHGVPVLPPPPSAHAPADVRSASEPRRVLVVDDEPALRLALARHFDRRGWMVAEAADGAQAIDLLLGDGTREPEEYDLVVCDLRMPGVSGVALHDRLAACRPEVLERTVFATGDLVSPEAAEFVARTRCLLLEKPYGFAAVDRLAERIVGRGVGV